MITRDDFFMGRDLTYTSDLTVDIELAAQTTIARVNELLHVFGEERRVTSGWRPPDVNANTPGAAKFSKHMLGLACDLEDHEGDLDEWCLDNLQVLERIGLWLEHPSATKGWCHVQTIPPKSRNRIFYP